MIVTNRWYQSFLLLQTTKQSVALFSFVVFAVIPKTSCQVLDRLVNWLANNSATRHTPPLILL